MFVRAETIVGEVSPTYASLPEVSLEMRSPLKFFLGFVIEVSLWRCTKLLPDVSPVFVCAGAIVGEGSPTYASLPEASLRMRFPLQLSLEFVAIEVSLWRCTKSLQYSFVQWLS